MSTEIKKESKIYGSLTVTCDGRLISEFQMNKSNISISNNASSDICIQEEILGTNKIAISYSPNADISPNMVTAFSPILINDKSVEKQKGQMILSHSLKSGDLIKIGSHAIQYLKKSTAYTLPLPNTSSKYRNSAAISLFKNGKSIFRFPIIKSEILIANTENCDIPLDDELISSLGLRISGGKSPFLKSKVGPIFLNNKLVQGSDKTPPYSSIALNDNDRIRIGNYEIIYHSEYFPIGDSEVIKDVLERAKLARQEIEYLVRTKNQELYSAPTLKSLSTSDAEKYITHLLDQSLERSKSIVSAKSLAQDAIRSLESCTNEIYYLTPEYRRANPPPIASTDAADNKVNLLSDVIELVNAIKNNKDLITGSAIVMCVIVGVIYFFKSGNDEHQRIINNSKYQQQINEIDSNYEKNKGGRGSSNSPSGTNAGVAAVDCMELKQFGEARGDNAFVVAEHVKNAERKGECKW